MAGAPPSVLRSTWRGGSAAWAHHPCEGDPLQSIVRQPALAYEEREFTTAHLVLAGLMDGSWQALEARSADGIAALSALAEAGGEVGRDDERAAIAAFRRERGLIAGDDFRAWREARDLEPADVSGYVRRGLALELAEPAARPEADQLAAVMRVQAICSGTLAALAATLASWNAARRGLGDDDAEADSAPLLAAARACTAAGLESLGDYELESHARAVAELKAAYDAFTTQVAAADKVDGTIAAHGMAWQHFQWNEADFASESAAREAVLLVREDGMGFAEVAQLAGGTAYTHTAYFDQLSKEVGGVLMATQPGSLAGPLPVNGNGAWRVVQVAGRSSADPADPVLRERARQELVSDALERHLVGRVRLLGEF